MSFQPQVPVMSQPPPVAAAPTKGKRRKGLIVLGLILMIGGLLGGVAIVAKGMSNYKEAVQSLARAPVGCTTTLVFDKPATFIIYAETKGKLGELGGDCEATGGEYEHSGDKLPKLSLTLEDPDGDAVDLDRGVTASYDVDGYVGTGVRTVNIEDAGTYHLNVESDETDFAVAIGKNPEKDNETLLAIGGGVALGGLVLGLLFFLLGLRRRRLVTATADVRNPAGPLPGWPPSTYAGAAPPPPSGPPPPPVDPGFRPAPPPGPQPVRLPEQPPIRLPEQPPAPGFAPPTLAPPAPPSGAPPVVPPNAAPPTAPGAPTLPPPGSSWTKPEDSDDD
jgi:hypothetical protein